jgi:uncharacterized radical SAM protein YgiQ
MPEFLPMSRSEMERLGWDSLDVLIVSGDAHIDHPAFGPALLGRWLVAHGFRAGIVAQPRWDTPDDIAIMGRPRLFAGVTAGALDSMLAHYTAFRKKRRDDAYTPGGRAGARPNRACLVYTGLVRNAFPGLPVVIGGIEASMRRASHYDFWTDSLRRSILLDSKADLLVYGMAEQAILEVAHRLDSESGTLPHTDSRTARSLLQGIPGTAYATRQVDCPKGDDVCRLPSHEEILADPRELMTATLALERQVHNATSSAVQLTGDRLVVFNPPAEPLTTEELDALYALPFTRRAHPSYRESIPALEMLQFSVTTHRGCGGGCSFCSLALHQGRSIRSRSEESVLSEVSRLTSHGEWRGSVTDVGGPSANMWGATCAGDESTCRRASCLNPDICRHFEPRQAELAELLSEISRLPGVRHVRVASGVRHDLATVDERYLRSLIGDFVGGQIKIAPEHCSDSVLRLMRKPSFETFEKFQTVFEQISGEAGKEQYVIPYLISAFPGCTDADMRELAKWLRDRNWAPRQVQCFVPTPGTVATAMYWAGVDPEGVPIFTARTDAQRLRQHRILLPTRRSRRRRPAEAD